MDNAHRKQLIDRYLAAYNAFDVDGMLALLAPAIRFENYAGGRLTAAATGIDAFRSLAEQAKALFAEREQRLTNLKDEDGALVAGIAYRGRLARDLPDGPPAGTVLELSGTSAFSFDGDLIVKIVDRS
jgi:ketosteroid isomerase-like protein